MMLIVLTAAAAGIAVIGMAAWWVAIPPVAMLGGYLLLLREVRHADAERALSPRPMPSSALSTMPSSGACAKPRRPPRSSSAKRRRTARVIDISERVRDELYDQYADAERRAVGD